MATAAGVAGAAVSGRNQAKASAAGLTLVAGSKDVTLDRVPDYGVVLDFGTHVVAGKNPVEIRATRKSYNDPIVAKQYVDGYPVTLPKGVTADWTGLGKFLHLTLTDAKGKKVLDRDQAFCLNGEGSRTRPDAPDSSPYPTDCAANAFTLGAVWGLQAGWSANTYNYYAEQTPVDLPVGKYKAKISINKVYRDYFKASAAESSVDLNVTIQDQEGCDPGQGAVEGCKSKAVKALRPGALTKASPAGPSGDAAHSAHAGHAGHGGQTPANLVPNAQRPAGKSGGVPSGPKPDLRALPAWQISVGPGEEGPSVQRDFLSFGATVWNGGPSKLVLDGFRQQGKDLMDAYQYFYDANGKQVGYQNTGTMEWDARPGHNHWHFTDFARYSLLSSNQAEVVRSQKEAFCLAATDSIDYTVKNAEWHPQNTDLHTACGNHGSLSVREVLDVGSGDTYIQSLPGQSFDVTDLKNGTYYIQVAANPENRLFESNTKNNVALRKVILGGTLHHRTVQVPPVGLVDVP